MIYLTKAIYNINILICIEKQLYESCRKQIDTLFSTFKISSSYSDNSIKMFVFSSITNSNTFEAHCKFHYDVNSKSSYFYLANFVEEFISHALFCTTIHGSLVQVCEKNVLIIGPRKSGKTTLTTFLIEHYNAKYIDDDHIYIHNGVYRGFNMPIFLRSSKVISSKNVTFDEESICRVAFTPTKKLEKVDSIDLILFPHYSCDSKNSVQQVTGTQLFKAIMNNIRFYNNQALLLKDISKLSNHCVAYEVSYNCFDWVDELIK